MRPVKLSFALASTLMGFVVLGQQRPPLGANPALLNQKPTPPKVATTIPAKGIHLTSEIGAFKIKRGSEALNYGNLKITFQGTVLVSGLNGTAIPSNGAELEFTQKKYKKAVYFSKSRGALEITGQFAGIQFFGQKVDAYYRGDGVIQMFGEFDKNLNTGLYWYDVNPSLKQYWGTSGMTITPTPYIMAHAAPEIKIKNVTGKG